MSIRKEMIVQSESGSGQDDDLKSEVAMVPNRESLRQHMSVLSECRFVSCA